MILQKLRDLSVAAKWADSGGFAEKQVHFLLMIEADGSPRKKQDGSLDCWFPLMTSKGVKGQALGRAYTDRPETLRRNQNYVDADCFTGRADRLVLASNDGGPVCKCRNLTHQLATDYMGAIPELTPVDDFYKKLSSDPQLLDELTRSLVDALTPFQPKPKPGKVPKLKLPETQEVAFCLSNANYQPIFDLAAIRQMWRTRQHPVVAESGATQATCLCCGQPCDPPRIQERVIKGLPGKGSKGVPLMSYNKESTQSHGLEDCLNAPMCAGCVDAYTIALNNLLKKTLPKGGPSYGGSEKLGGLAFIYWFRNPESIRPIDRIINGVQHIEKRLESMQTGADFSLTSRMNHFFLAVMSAPTLGRAVVHDWIDESLDHIDSNLARWFADAQIINRFTGDVSAPIRLAEPGNGVKGAAWADIMDRHIPSALGREIKDKNKIRERAMRWDIQKDTILAIFERALLGRKLPLSIMHLALERLREGIQDDKEKKRSALPGFTTARLGLMRATLNDHPELLWQRRPIMPGLDRDRGDPAYVCGRLLAILSRIQAKAMSARDDSDEKARKLCANVVSRYYGAASSRPATGLYLPLRMRVHHLAKLDRDDSGEATGRRIDLQDALQWINPDNLPKTLSPAQQCVFALGFEHQMAEFFKPHKSKSATDSGDSNDANEPQTQSTERTE